MNKKKTCKRVQNQAQKVDYNEGRFGNQIEKKKNKKVSEKGN